MQKRTRTKWTKRAPPVPTTRRRWTKQSDNEMIVLETILNYLDESKAGTRTIGRGHLKQLSNEVIKERKGVYFGGTFERVLKRLEEQGAIQRENKGKRKSSKIPRETLIHLNISKIQNLFDEKRRLFNIANQPDVRLGEEHELEADKWEKIVCRKLLFLFEHTRKLWINLGDEKLREVDSISKDAAYQLATNILTRVFNVRIKPSNSKQWELTEDEVWELASNSKQWELTEDEVWELARLTMKIASRNLTQPFTLTIDYSGYSMESPLWMESAISKISPYIMKYADVNNFKLTAEEIENISAGSILLLRPTLRALVNIFWKNHVVPILNDALAALNFIDTKAHLMEQHHSMKKL